MPVKLAEIVSEVKDYWGLRRKQPIGNLVKVLRREGFKCPHVLSSIGEDSAAIDLGGDNLILLSTDAVIPELAQAKPYIAGYAAILVNVNDIYAAGGRPIVAMVNIAFTDLEVGVQMMEGICEAGQKFRVEVVRGHTTPNAPMNSVSASICGTVPRDNYVSAGGAREGDHLVLAIDLQGRVSPNYEYGWDTTALKQSAEILTRYEAMRVLSDKNLLNASKDLSNGGIIGTILLMLEYAQKGAEIDLEAIPIPKGLDLRTWLKMYISTGFVIATSQERVNQVISIFAEHKLHAAKIGNVNDSQKLVLTFDKDSMTIFDFRKETIVAPPPPPQLNRVSALEEDQPTRKKRA
ncbi:MAG: AIR synthase related protein [Promethearchaeota archaeon]